ncbi:helix-turn-helix domain-containing protein [Winogradskyella schleiferi]|uniref:helix-turn-helix domain-containing protein n=1 Tax=Winogradskyella schleiferi TaxID=2686078 RepID=UPI0015BD7DD4|nr:helix-turn-helix domain-containing protein [Winogradskyella schleiferi]
MRKLDLLQGQGDSKDNRFFADFDISNKNIMLAVNDVGVSFANLTCNYDTSKLVNSILKKNAVHFIYPNSDDVTFQINGKRKKRMICPGQRTSIYMSTKHVNSNFYVQSGKQQDISILSMDFPLFESYREVDFNNYLENYYNSDAKEQIAMSAPSKDNRVKETIEKAKKYCQGSKPDSLLVKAVISELQYIFIQQYLILNNHTILEDSEIEKISTIPTLVKNQIAKKITVEDIANELDLSIHKLQLGCEIVFKCGVVSLINDIKLENIANLLFTTTEPLPDVLYKNGYLNRSYFYKIFEEKFQCTPFQY